MNDVELSASIAQDAGRLLLALREDFGAIESRERADELRDAADQASHVFITEALRKQRPDDAILSEEGKDDAARLSADRVWIVDPLDGTWEFGQGRTDFAVHIALWLPQAQELQACTVDLPAQGLCRSTGDRALAPGPLPSDRPIRIVASRSRPPADLHRIVESLSARLRDTGMNSFGAEVVDVGSVGAKVNEVISGRAEAYIHDTGFYEWDVAAPLGVAQHFGYDAMHKDASAVTFNHMPPYVTDLVVSHPLLTLILHESILARP